MGRFTIKKGNVGKSVLGGYEKCSALVGYWGVVGSGTTVLAEGSYAVLTKPSEMVAYGMNPKVNTMLCRHIEEYFRMAKDGAKLYVLNVKPTGTKSYEALIEAGVRKMIAAVDGEIFNLAYSYIPTTPTTVDGLNAEIVPAIRAAQKLADWARETNRPLHIALECSGLGNVTAATMLDLRNIKNSEAVCMCPQVTLMVGQDWDFAEKQTGNNQKYADVGTLLGCMAAQPVSYNVGEVATMILTNANRGDWVNAGLSSHEKVREKEEELEALNEKGYVLGEYYSGVICLNDDHVCAPIIVDKDGNLSESTIAMSRTNAKVARELYAAYLPKVKATVPLDPTTGKLGVGMVKYLEEIGNDVFGNMAAKQEISGGETVVDEQSNLTVGKKALTVYYSWVPMGCISRIEGTVNIKKSI